MTAIDIPPPGAPRDWAHMPWRARRKWLQQHRVRSPACPPVQEHRSCAETARLTCAMLAEGASPEDVVERLESSPAAIYTALRKTGHPVEARPFARLDAQARRAQADSGSKTGRPYAPTERTLQIVAYVQKSVGVRSAEQVCADLGLTPHGVADALDRIGRPELATPYKALRADAMKARRERKAQERLDAAREREEARELQESADGPP